MSLPSQAAICVVRDRLYSSPFSVFRSQPRLWRSGEARVHFGVVGLFAEEIVHGLLQRL
jgi:hypothetical protein